MENKVMRRTLLMLLLLPAVATAPVGSAAADPRHDARDALGAVERMERSADAEAPGAGTLGGDLESWVAAAARGNPGLEADLASWRAATEGIRQTARIPDPQLGYGAYLSPIETRVGPQRHRLGLRQMIPWPGGPIARSRAAAFSSLAAGERWDASLLTLRRKVGEVYWMLWANERSTAVLEQQAVLLDGIIESMRGRLETGRGGVADLAQAELRRAMLGDRIAGLVEDRRALEARLRMLLGGRPDGAGGAEGPSAGIPSPTDSPTGGLPAMEGSLRDQVAGHPSVPALLYMARAAEQRARARRADGLPNISVGLDWIITGPSPMSGVADSGKDAVILNLGLSLPLWRGSLRAGVRAEEHRAAEARSRAQARTDELVASFERALTDVRDADRRVRLYRDTLLPQADAAWDSVRGAWEAGEGSTAQVLMAARDRLDVELMLVRARSDHARAWTRLEEAVGKPLLPMGAAP